MRYILTHDALFEKVLDTETFHSFSISDYDTHAYSVNQDLVLLNRGKITYEEMKDLYGGK